MFIKFSIYRSIHEAKYFLYLLAILTSQLSFCQMGTASSANRGYTPPINQESTTTQRRQAAGSRGCGTKEKPISLSLLVPQQSDIKNLENIPTVVFDISSIPEYPVVITLTEPNKIEPIFEREILINRPGIWTVVPDSEVNLLQNQQYVVTVLVACNNSNSSKSIYVRSIY